jgi:hypothetical protein
VTRDDLIDRIYAAPTTAPPEGVDVRLWHLACDLRACGVTVAGHGARLVASVGVRSADVDPLARRWSVGGRRVVWPGGIDDVDVAIGIAQVLLGAVPEWQEDQKLGMSWHDWTAKEAR